MTAAIAILRIRHTKSTYIFKTTLLESGSLLKSVTLKLNICYLSFDWSTAWCV